MRKVKTFEGRRHSYDSETAVEVARRSSGEFGDPAGFEEILYQTKKGLFFILGRGGADSPYPTEDIKPISRAQAKKFQA